MDVFKKKRGYLKKQFPGRFPEQFSEPFPGQFPGQCLGKFLNIFLDNFLEKFPGKFWNVPQFSKKIEEISKIVLEHFGNFLKNQML